VGPARGSRAYLKLKEKKCVKIDKVGEIDKKQKPSVHPGPYRKAYYDPNWALFFEVSC